MGRLANRPRRLFVFLIPAVWAVFNVATFQSVRGDNVGGWLVSSLPAWWVIPFLGWLLPSRSFILLAPPAGAVVMAVLGAAMDRLRAPWVLWLLAWPSATLALCGYTLWGYPSWERAMAQWGSFAAILLPSINLGLLAATVLAITAAVAGRFGRGRGGAWQDSIDRGGVAAGWPGLD